MKTITRVIATVSLSAFTIGAGFSTQPSEAQEKFPNRPIRLIVPFNAGGAADIVARVIGQSVSEKLGQPVVVENRPGATGAIGSLAVARAAPDGYTILMAVISSHAVAPAMKKEPPFDPIKDFGPIVRIANSVHTLVARTSLPVSDTKSLIAYAKENPGKVTYGSSGLASFPFLGGKLMERAVGVDMIHVPFSGDGPAMTAVVSQNLDILFTPSARSYVEAKSVKLLGIASLERASATPDWPTLDETGLPRFTLISWVGFMAPAGTPAAVVETLNKATNEALAESAIRDRLEQIGYTVGGGSAADYVESIRADVDRIRALGIQMD
jgi:tripartite-type tricarboxylate transporter receptor subunit TctC